MKYNIYFRFRGPDGETEAPNNTNPVEAESIGEICENLGKPMPSPFGCEGKDA